VQLRTSEEVGVDTVTAIKIVGHKSEKMYKRCDNVNEVDLLKASAKPNTLIALANLPSLEESVTEAKGCPRSSVG
jgi:hypothetical protein